MPYQLLLKGGTLIDPAQAIHAVKDIAFAEGKVAAVGHDLPQAEAEKVIDCTGSIVAPGMIDLHVHVFWGISHFGIEPDPHCIAKGVTTAVDAGSAGADTFPGFRKWGDALVFELQEGSFELWDTHGQVRVGNQWLVPTTVVRAGEVYQGEGKRKSQ